MKAIKHVLIVAISFFLVACGSEKKPLTKEEKEIMMYSGKQGLMQHRRSKLMRAPKGSTMDLLDQAAKINQKNAKTLNKLKKKKFNVNNLRRY